MCILFIGLIISNCSILDSDYEYKVSLILESTSIAEGDSITAFVINNNTHPVTIYKNTHQTQLQKRADDGKWYRFGCFSSTYSDWYNTVDSKSTRDYSISYNEIQKYHDKASTCVESSPFGNNVQGKYRFIFDIADEDFQNRKEYVSDVFEVK